MCNLTCLNGECQYNNHSIPQCMCNLSFIGSRCGYKNGIIWIELPIALIILLIISIFGLRIHELIFNKVNFRQVQDDYYFPRWQKTGMISLKCFSSKQFSAQGILLKWILPFDGQPCQSIPFDSRIWVNCLVLLVLLAQLIEWLQMISLLFLPIVPWSNDSKLVKQVAEYLILYKFWYKMSSKTYSDASFLLAIISIPIVFLVFSLLSLKRCALLKPQPRNTPSEDISTILLRCYTSWLFLPIMIIFILPSRCIYTCFIEDRSNQLYIPEINAQCFNSTQLMYSLSGFAAAFIYWTTSFYISIQLNCESSAPIPTLWVTKDYVNIHILLKVILALVVVIFGRSNPFGFTAVQTIVYFFFVYFNYRLKPCMYSMVNHLRLLCSIILLWTAGMSCFVCFSDNDLYALPFFIWWVGCCSIIGIGTLASFYVLDGMAIIKRYARRFERKIRLCCRKEGKISYEVSAGESTGSINKSRSPVVRPV